MARTPSGVDFDSIDGKPTFLFFVLVWPENSTGQHLKALARISRVFKDSEFRSQLLEAQSAAEMHRIIADEQARRAMIRARCSKVSQAMSTIIDANITTFIAASILYLLGSGPVKGFAVTLMVGIMTSMFSAIMVTRFIVNTIYGGRAVKQLSIGPFIKAA